MPKIYWSYAFSAAVYLINRLLTPTLSLLSPYHKLFGVAPNYQKLRIFGCLWFPWLRPYATNKLDDRSKRCVFLSYSLTQSAYLEPHSGQIYTSRHVQFVETEFPIKITLSSSTQPNWTFPTQLRLHCLCLSPCARSFTHRHHRHHRCCVLCHHKFLQQQPLLLQQRQQILRRCPILGSISLPQLLRGRLTSRLPHCRLSYVLRTLPLLLLPHITLMGHI